MKLTDKLSFRIPRWLSVPSVAAALLGLVSLAYPGGLVAACTDVIDYSQHTQHVDHCRKADDRMERCQTRVKARLAMKEEWIAELIAGRATLDATTAAFIEMNEGDEKMLTLLHERYKTDSIEETTARNVVEFARQRTLSQPNRATLLEPIEKAFEARFEHPAAQ